MTILFAGNDIDAFTPFSLPNIAASTDVSRFDADFVQAALRVEALGQLRGVFPAQTEGWAHFSSNLEALFSGQDEPTMELRDTGTGQVVLRIKGENNVFALEYWNGASFTRITPALPIFADITHTIDVFWRIADVDGSFAIYLDGQVVAQFSGDTALPGFTQIDELRLLSADHQNTGQLSWIYYSEVLVATTPTLGMRVASLTATANGFNTQWAGDVTDINDVGIANDATAITSDTAGQIETFVMSDLSAEAAALTLNAVCVNARARKQLGGPQNLQLAVRVGASDFFSANVAGIGLGFDGFQNIWETNPATLAPWTASEVNAIEAGVRSQT